MKEAALGDLIDQVLLSPIGSMGKHGSNVKIGIAVSKRIDAERKKDADKSGIGTKITGIAPSLFTIGNKISSYRLLETALNAMAIIGMIGRINDSRTMIDALMSQSWGGCQFIIDLGAGLVCMIVLVNVLVIFQGTKKSLKKWQIHECPMNLFSVAMLTLIGWNQGRFAINQCGRHSFPSSVQKD